MSSFLNSFKTFANNQYVNINNAVGQFRSKNFDSLDAQIDELKKKEDDGTITSIQETKLFNLKKQRDSLNESVEYKPNVKHRLGIYFFRVKKYNGSDDGSDAIISNVIYFPGNTLGSNELMKPLQMLADYTNQSMMEIDKGLNLINNSSFFPNEDEIRKKQEYFDENKQYEIAAIGENDRLEGEIELKQGKREINDLFNKFKTNNGLPIGNIGEYSEPLKITDFDGKS